MRRWLGIYAFRMVFGRKASRYGAVLTCLDEQLAMPPYCHLYRQLAGVVNAPVNAVLDELRY